MGQIRLPNATDPKFRAELKAKNGDTVTISDVIVKDNGVDREFVFDLIYDFGKGFTQIKTLKVSTKYSELPVKYDYLQPGKWTLWVKREDQQNKPAQADASHEPAWNWAQKDFNFMKVTLSALIRKQDKWDVAWENGFSFSFSEKQKSGDVSIVLKNKIFYLNTMLIKEYPMGNLNGIIDFGSLISTDGGKEGIKTAEGCILVYRPMKKNHATVKPEDMDFYVIVKIEQKNQEKKRNE